MKNSHFRRKRKTPVDYKTINDILKSVRDRAAKVYFEPYVPELHGRIGFDAFIEDKLKYLSITTSYHGVKSQYIFDKSTGSVEEGVRGCSAGMNAYMCLIRMMKDKKDLCPVLVKDSDLDDDGKCRKPFSTSPMIWFSEEHNNKEHIAFGYDMNSAYSYAMLQPIPDTRGVPSVNIISWNAGIVASDEIGFTHDGDLVPVGDYAIYRFKAVESPFRPFVELYFGKKINAKTPEEKQRAKDVLNMAVGYLQRKNPFIRACVVSRCNELIKSLMDENTIYCNTDSIVSLKKRDDLKLGTNVGEWKLDNQGTFRYIDAIYQWNNEKPKYRGTPTEWFKDNFNLLTDAKPETGNLYYLDREKLKIVRRKMK